MKVRFSVAQINPTGGDLRGNARKILEGIRIARDENCDLVVFPEMALTGYCLDEKLLINKNFLRLNRQLLVQEIAPACQGLAAIVGFVDFDESRTGPDQQLIRYNAAAVVQEGELLQIAHKRLLPAYRYFDDKRYFQPGTEVDTLGLAVNDKNFTIGVLICEDLWDEGYDLKPYQILCQKGAEYLFCINASPFVASRPGQKDGKRFRRVRTIQNQQALLPCPMVYVNTVGVGDNGKNIIPFDGLSQAFDASGRLVLSLPQFKESQATIEFENGQADAILEPRFDRDGEVFEALSMGVRDYYQKVGAFEGVLQTISGGIDSALGTAIAFQAVGRELLSVYNLPSRHNSPTTRKSARQLAENLGLELETIPIQSILDQVVQDFEKHLHPFKDPVSVENLQARIRGLIMMAESNDRRALLISNGNETEIALGYATLYGDMVGGISVIGDLPKPDVYRLAAYANRAWGSEVIPRAVFETPPSAELRDEQVDPFDYEIVSPLVDQFIEEGIGPREITERFDAQSLDESAFGEAVEKIYSRFDKDGFQKLAADLYRALNQSVYKRLQGAPIIVVTRRGFGFDLRETIINGWDG